MKRLLTATLLLLLAACATAPAGDDLAAYPAALVGAYDNAVQYAQAPDDMKRAASPDADWLDQQTVTFSSVTVPALGPAVVYAEWRGMDGAVSRQRLWAFRRDAGGVRIDLYSAREPARLADPTARAALTTADLDGYGPTCVLAVTSNGPGAWNAQTDPYTCRASSPAGELTIDARVTVMPTGVLYQESARQPDGAYAFRIPGGPPYDLRRRP